MKLFTAVIAATAFLAKATSETKVTASVTGNVDQDKVAIDVVEENLDSSKHVVVSSLRDHAKVVDLNWKANLNAHLASGLPNNRNTGGQAQGAAIRAFDIQNVVKPDEESIERPEDILDSKLCKGFFDNAYKEVFKIIENESEEAISNFLCSQISLTLAADKVREAKQTIIMEQNPCAKALKESYVEGEAEEIIHYFMESNEMCKAEIGKEIAEIKGGSPNSYVRVDEGEGFFSGAWKGFLAGLGFGSLLR